MGWRCKALSRVGRRTLIKSVALALPTYSISTEDVPVIVCNKMDSTIRRFWWNPKRDKGKYLVWKSWESLCRSKEKGGLGFKESKLFNQALLAKLTWWVASGRDSICIRALRSKYKMGACFIMGNGDSIDMWKDPWVPWLEGFTPIPLHANTPQPPLRVSNLLDSSNRIWKTNVLQELVDSHSLAAFLKIPIPIDAPQDRLIWTLNPSGCFSVKSAISSCLASRINLKTIRAQNSIQFALTLENIWIVRNQVVHNDLKINHLAIVKNLEVRVLEHWHILNPLLVDDTGVVSNLVVHSPSSC
uniref:Reverse transcriptase zinc-binding domain-containing protein n=1 Tax=Fagus sylvatica TaxID=28930 RepID=A0A2N9H3Q7_FAGSY